MSGLFLDLMQTNSDLAVLYGQLQAPKSSDFKKFLVRLLPKLHSSKSIHCYKIIHFFTAYLK